MQVNYGKLSEFEDIAFIGSLWKNLKSEYKGKFKKDLLKEIGGTSESWDKRLQAWARGEYVHTSYHVVEAKAREIAEKYGDVLLRDKMIETPWAKEGEEDAGGNNIQQTAQ